ncbi:hypothetical protein [Pseudovibrio sp. POLY-S9]|uniref:hypothetical protein n=1 Tax=Pseudovibrio sp. POLY-S9 TaxID=1576596 RepID=UPI00070FC7B9|nr:hypothetical protein [Pseudovibrio sp. POLY-S9]
MTQPLVKLGLLVCLPILLHTFVPMQAWWPALRYSSSYKQDAQERTVEFEKLSLEVAGKAIVVMNERDKSHIFSERTYLKLLKLQGDRREPSLVAMHCKGSVCTNQPSDAHFATLMLALTALILAFAMKFGLRGPFPLGEATDIGMSDRDA